MAQRLCQSDEPGRESFQVVVVGHAPRPKADEYASRVGTPSGLSTADHDSTSHGFQSSSKVDIKHEGISSSAAIGGYILVTNLDGTETTYGLTAGHVLPQTAIDTPLSDDQWDGSMPSPDSSDSEDDLTSIPEYSAKGRGQSLLESFIGPRGEPAWTGMILAEATFSREARDRDWALIERIRANEVASLYTAIRYRSVVLDPSESIQDGASGTWVTSGWTRSLGRRIGGPSEPISAYGQVVADDIFGDVYMIPLSDIIDDIKVLTRAAAIRLPESLMELEHMLSKKRGREEADQVGSEEASSVPETHTSTHDKVSRMKARSVTNDIIDYPLILDSDVPTNFTDAIAHYNALQSESPWRNRVASTSHFEDDDNAEEEDEVAHGDVDAAEEENDDDSTSDVGHGAPETKIEPWWTSEEDRCLKRMRSDGASWSRIMEEFPNRVERKVKEHWYKDLRHGANGEKPSATTSTRAGYGR
ncbi:hypothetical protein J4E86_010448 [Alternaria arbusti]|uniref:uncharacterized protein n=1 Tax=Alternaria arbusti TaxID=232088 RepID=UPI00221FEAB0|nr:uncharacterized protein J4E86_010448 [Alternaria arbusti]KAI4941416.1 hypothetical protein J4E86_010448 [Alternaria arbusti]